MIDEKDKTQSDISDAEQAKEQESKTIVDNVKHDPSGNDWKAIHDHLLEKFGIDASGLIVFMDSEKDRGFFCLGKVNALNIFNAAKTLIMSK